MARIRSIHPDLLRSEEFASWSPWAQVAFIKIWTEMDDQGRVLANTKLLAALLFPFNDEQGAFQMEQHISEWEKSGSVCRYEVDGKKLMHAVSWRKYQRPQKPTPSKLPTCPTHDPSEPGVSRLSHSPTIGVSYPSDTEKEGEGEEEKEREREKEGEGAARAAWQRPRCPKHRNDPDPPNCRACKHARLEWERSQLDAKPTVLRIERGLA